MKKSVVAGIFLVLILSLSMSVFAADSPVPDVAQGLDSVSGFQGQTNAVLQETVEIPQNFVFVAMLFGVKGGGKIDLSYLIVLLCLWVWAFLFIRQALTFVPFFSEGWISWVGGAVITMLIAISGGLLEVARFFFNLGGFFGVVRNQSLFQLLLSVVVLAVFFGVMSKIMKKVTRELRKAKAEALGRTLKEGAESAKVFSRGVKDLSKEDKK